MLDFSFTWFEKGLMHPVVTPSHIILLLGLGLLLGQQGKSHLVRHLALFALSIIGGFVLDQVINYFVSENAARLAYENNELILLLLALIIGLLSVLKLHLPGAITMLLLLVSGVMLGLDSQPHIIPGLHVSFSGWIAGAALGIWSIVALLALVSLLMRDILQGMVIRVLGSWIATSAIFVLTLLLARR